jgi:pSer/pThr/pTyr-binding forkhead associated (FHA) protein
MKLISEPSMDLFLEACGATGPLQLSVERYARPEGGRRVLHRPFALIGRGPGNDVPLDETLVSRRHAYLQMIGGRLFCLDLGSRTGIHWDQEAKKSGWLERDHVIRIGTYSVRYADGGPSNALPPINNASPLTAYTLDGRPLPEVVLEFLNVNPKRTWEMNGVMALVGRAPECRIRLKGGGTSEYHCSLLRTPLGVWVVDLVSREGVRMNQERVAWAYLANGAQFQVGSFLIRVWHNAPPLPHRPILASESANHRAEAIGSLGYPGEERILFDTEAGPRPHAAVAAGSALAPAEALDHALAPVLDPNEVNEAVLQPLVHQFMEMQQQMSDQFQQAIGMVLEMFTGMHRDQVAIIRQEIDRLQQLTDELHALEEEAGQVRAAPGPADAAPGAQPSDAAPLPREVRHETGEDPAQTPPHAGYRFTPDTDHPPARNTPDVTVDEEPAPLAEADGPTPEGAPAASHTDGDVHLWVFQRIEAIQEERKSRMRKIYNFLRGK